MDTSLAYILITRPRRWGKTMNMDMIRRFLSIEVDEFGKAKEINKYRVLFQGGEIEVDGTSKTLNPLAIAKINEEKYLQRNQGQHPVIFITLSSLPSEENKILSEEEMLSRIKRSIHNSYRDHEYLYWNLLKKNIQLFKLLASGSEFLKTEGESIDQLRMNLESLIDRYSPSHRTNPVYTDAEKFKMYLSTDGEMITKDRIVRSITFLSRLLCEYFNKKVFVIVDEYDAPLNSSIGKAHFPSLVGIIREMFRGIKNNNAIEKVIFTGILRIAKESLFSGLNNFCDFTVLDEDYAQFFGFTESEVEELLKKFMTKTTKEETSRQLSQFKFWYNGYRIGEYIIYNP